MILGAFLILVGLLWWLSGQGYVLLAAWDLWKLWPLALVALGLDLLLMVRRPGGRRLAVLAFLGLSGAALLWLALPTSWPALPAPLGPGLIQERFNVPLAAGIKDVRLELEAPVAELSVKRSEAAPPQAVDALIERLSRQAVVLDRRRTGQLLIVELRTHGDNLRFRGLAPQWVVALHPKLRYDLQLSLGVGESKVDLRGLRLENLRIRAGVGSVELHLPGTGGYTARVEGGVGDLTVLLPPGLPVALEVARGRGEVYVDEAVKAASPPGGAAPLQLYVRSGIGKIRVLRETDLL